MLLFSFHFLFDGLLFSYSLECILHHFVHCHHHHTSSSMPFLPFWSCTYCVSWYKHWAVFQVRNLVHQIGCLSLMLLSLPLLPLLFPLLSLCIHLHFQCHFQSFHCCYCCLFSTSIPFLLPKVFLLFFIHFFFDNLLQQAHFSLLPLLLLFVIHFAPFQHFVLIYQLTHSSLIHKGQPPMCLLCSGRTVTICEAVALFVAFCTIHWAQEHQWIAFFYTLNHTGHTLDVDTGICSINNCMSSCQLSLFACF